MSTPPAGETWLATAGQASAATRFARDEEDYLDNENRDVGRRLSEAEHELFVSCDPGPALQQQFEHLRPEYIAVHDIGAPTSRKLLAGVAAASQRKLQKLIVRRQSHGTPLATLQFLELNATDGRIVRLYTTDADADTVSRRALLRVLLSFSRLAVVMISDIPAHAVEHALRPLQDEMATPPWHNRHLLILPLTSAGSLATLGAELGRRSGIQVLTTPLVTRPSEAWQYIVNTYGRLKTDGTLTPNRRQADLFGGATAPAAPKPMPPIPSGPAPLAAAHPPVAPASDRNSASATTPSSVYVPHTLPTAMPAAPRVPERPTETARAAPAQAFAPTSPPAAPAAPAHPPLIDDDPSRQYSGMEETVPMAFPMHSPAQVSTLAALAPEAPMPGLDLLRRYLERIGQITGLLSCCLLEVATGRELLHAGSRPDGHTLSRHGAALMTAMLDASRGLGLGSAPADAAITLGAHHLILRAVPRHTGLALHAVLDKHHANLVLARLQLLRIDAMLEET